MIFEKNLGINFDNYLVVATLGLFLVIFERGNKSAHICNGMAMHVFK